MITEEMQLEAKRLVGREYEDEFILNEELVIPLIKENNENLFRDTTIGYGIVYGLYTNYIIGFNLDRVIEFAVPMPIGHFVIPPSPDFKETSYTLIYKYQKKRKIEIAIWVVYVILLIFTFLFCVLI